MVSASRRPSTITERMRTALEMLFARGETGIRGTEDLVSLGFTYAALTGLERRRLARHEKGRYVITNEGKTQLDAIWKREDET